MIAVADDAKAGADMDSSGAFLLHVCRRERFRIDGFRKAARVPGTSLMPTQSAGAIGSPLKGLEEGSWSHGASG